MNCEQLRAKLDAYMDGELSDVELREMEAHAAACEDCERELASARLVREALGALPEEVAVPLEAQASWRRAVRAEAQAAREAERAEAAGRPKRRWLRAAYAVAAALVLVLGASAMLRAAPGDRVAKQPLADEAAPLAANVALEEAAAMPTRAVIARDGEIASAELAPENDYAAWRKYAAEDVEAACAAVEALVEEYSGSFAAENPEEGAAYRVELPREYLDDFLSAVSHVGAEQDSETMDTQGETAVVYIQIDEAVSE